MPPSTSMIGAPVLEINELGRETLHLILTDHITIGRECEGINLTDGRISRRHAQFRSEDGSVWVTDLESRNGTFIGERRIAEPIELHAGEVVLLGNTTVKLISRAPDHDSERFARGQARASADVLESSIQRVAAMDLSAVSGLPGLAPDHGTVTIAFTDIESSTELASRSGDRPWIRVLTSHNAIVHEEVGKHRGLVVGSAGDGFHMVFSSARSAVECMVGLQRRLETHPDLRLDGEQLKVRIGLHTGEVLVDNGDVYGTHVNMAARVAGEAQGGEILVSSIVREIVSSFGDLRFGDSRLVELKGIENAQTVHEVLWK